MQSAPAVQSEIPNGDVQITGNYTLDEAKALQTVLESGVFAGELRVRAKPGGGPHARPGGARLRRRVALIGLAVVMLYLLVFYKGLGLVTAAAMAVFAVLYLGILAALSAFGQFSLSLAGIAGIVLTIGMAADSSILTMERFREESAWAEAFGRFHHGREARHRDVGGRGLGHARERAFAVLPASASVKGFGLTLALGIVCDIVMMLAVQGAAHSPAGSALHRQSPRFLGRARQP